MRKLVCIIAALALSQLAMSEVQIINGRRFECTDDGICRDLGPVEEAEPESAAPAGAAEPEANPLPARLIMGTRTPEEFVAFLEGREAADANPLADKSLWLVLLIALAGGFLMNLTPCVLPMMPINLMIIGRSAMRGALYGLGLAVAYGVLGVLAAFFGRSFGSVQGNPWFNVVVAAIFIALGLALSGAFLIDLSKNRGGVSALRGKLFPGLFAFVMGVVGAVLAGACVAPVLLAVLAQSAVLAGEGRTALAVALPFVLGLGMGLPWPLAGAGLKVLPKPGNWMKSVNRLFAFVVFCFAAWYIFLAYRGFTADERASAVAVAEGGVIAATPSDFPERLAEARKAGRPVFVDCWATWCKNCLAMDETTLKDERVAKLVRDKFTVIKLEVKSDIGKLKKIPGFESIIGLPAYLVFE